MRKNLSYIFIILVVATTAFYGSIAAYKLLFHSKIAGSIVSTGLVLDSTKVYLFTNAPASCSNDTVVIKVNSKLMPSVLGSLIKSAKGWKFFLSSEIVDPTKKDNLYPFLPWCVEASGSFFREDRFYEGNDSIDEEALIKGIKFNRPGGDKMNDRVAIRLSKRQGLTMLNTHSEGLGVTYPIFNTTDTNYFEVDFGAIPFDTNEISNKIFSFPENYGVENARFMLCVAAKNSTISHSVKNSHNAVTESSTNQQFRIGDVFFEIRNQYRGWLKIILIIYILSLICFQVRLIYKIMISPNPFYTSIVTFQAGINALLFLGIPLLILSFQQDPGRIWIIPLGIILNLNLYFFLSWVRENKLFQLLWQIVRKYSQAFLLLTFLLGCGSLFLASNEAVFGVPILHIGKILILMLLSMFRIQSIFQLKGENRNLNPNLWLKIFFANIENLMVILFSLFITVITHDIGSLVFTLCAILLLSLLSNKKLSFLPGVALLFTIVVMALSLSQMDAEFVKQNRKVYRLVSWILPPTEFKNANEADRETSSEHYYLLKNKWAQPEPAFTSTVIPANWKTIFFSDYAVLWSFILGGWAFLLFAVCTLLMLIYNLLRLIFIALKVFKTNDTTAFYFPETKSKVVVFLLALTLIQFIYPFFSNFLCLPLTGQSVPALSTSKVEIIFLILLLTALQFIYNQKNYYHPLERISAKKKLMTYISIRKRILGFTIVIAILILSVNFVRAQLLARIGDKMNWPISYDEETKDTLSLMTDRNHLNQIAVNYLKDDSYTRVPRSKQEHLRNLAAYYYYGKPYSKLFFLQKNYPNSVSITLGKVEIDRVMRINKLQVADQDGIYGYSIPKYNNGKPINVITSKYLSGYPLEAESVDIGLQVALNRALEEFVRRSGIGNVGTIYIAENNSGSLKATASYPFFFNNKSIVVEHFNRHNPHNIRLISTDDNFTNVSDSYLLPGSLVKPIIAYAALQAIDGAEGVSFNGVNFNEFLKKSDDNYSAELFKRLLSNPVALDQAIHNDFKLPLYSQNQDALIDAWPQQVDFSKELDRMNPIYRLSIGQQQTFSFRKMVEIYCRIASGSKTALSYDSTSVPFEVLSIPGNKLNILHEAMNGALYGTANNVRLALEENGINYESFICKTGTAQKRVGKSNATSSFILCTDRYTIGIQLAGDIPENLAGFSAKNLFASIIPLLKCKQIIP